MTTVGIKGLKTLTITYLVSDIKQLGHYHW